MPATVSLSFFDFCSAFNLIITFCKTICTVRLHNYLSYDRRLKSSKQKKESHV